MTHAVLLTIGLWAQAPAPKYMSPKPTDPPGSIAYRSLPLRDERPEGVRETAKYRGTKRRYSQLEFGVPGSQPMTLVIDAISATEADLYIDRERDREIEAADRIPLENGRYTIRLDADFPGVDDALRTRTVALRRMRGDRAVGVATLGYVEGIAKLGDRALPYRQIDGNANGRFGDPADLLLLDRNRDGAFDPLSERFPQTSVLTLDGVRYALRGDQAGARLHFEPAAELGRVKLAWKPAKPGYEIVSFETTLLSKDGDAVALRAGETVETPAGEYRVGAVTICLYDRAADRYWNFRFAASRSRVKWLTVPKHGELGVDPFQGFKVGARVGVEKVRPGVGERFQMFFDSETGLYIVECTHDDPNASTQYGRKSIYGANASVGKLTMKTSDGRLVDTIECGFF